MTFTIRLDMSVYYNYYQTEIPRYFSLEIPRYFDQRKYPRRHFDPPPPISLLISPRNDCDFHIMTAGHILQRDP